MYSIVQVHCIMQRKQQHNSLRKRWDVAHDDLPFNDDQKLRVSVICRAHAADEYWGVNLTQIGIRCCLLAHK